MRILVKVTAVLMACATGLGMAQVACAEAPAPPAHGGPGTHEGGHGKRDFVAMLASALDLSADQHVQVQAIFEATHARAEAISDDPALSQQDRTAKMKELHEAAMSKVRALLTADQLTKLDAIQERLPHGASMGHDPGVAHRDPGDHHDSGMVQHDEVMVHRHPSIDDIVGKFATPLNLTADQQTRIRAILEVMHPQMVAVEDDKDLSPIDRKTKLRALRDSTHEQIRAALTSDQQKTFDEILKEHMGADR